MRRYLLLGKKPVEAFIYTGDPLDIPIDPIDGMPDGGVVLDIKTAQGEPDYLGRALVLHGGYCAAMTEDQYGILSLRMHGYQNDQ